MAVKLAKGQVVNGFELWYISDLVDTDMDYLVSYFDDIDEGAVEEVLLDFDNGGYSGSLRVVGRGSGLYLEGQFHLGFDDGFGRITADKIDSVAFRLGSLDDRVHQFLNWFEKKSGEQEWNPLDRFR